MRNNNNNNVVVIQGSPPLAEIVLLKMNSDMSPSERQGLGFFA